MTTEATLPAGDAPNEVVVELSPALSAGRRTLPVRVVAAGVTVGDVQSAGVVGAGGGGFPTHAKLTAQVDTVIVNGAECEPLLHKDKEILRTRGELVVRGLAVAMALTGAQRGIGAVKEKYADVLAEYGIKPGDTGAVAKAKDAVLDKLQRWEHWHTDKELVREVRSRAGLSEAMPAAAPVAAAERPVAETPATEAGQKMVPLADVLADHGIKPDDVLAAPVAAAPKPPVAPRPVLHSPCRPAAIQLHDH